MLTEVDTRSGGTVTFYLSAYPAVPRYRVDVASVEGEKVASIAAETATEALEAYRHPFAPPDVPDIFRSARS